MDEETFNMSMRKFLKKMGVTSQQELEKAVREALDSGRLQGHEELNVEAMVHVAGLELTHRVVGTIKLAPES